MAFELKEASRSTVRPLIGLYSESGCGKTLSALYLARGIAGDTGLIAMIDSESGRGSLYADVLPGGYKTLDLCAPFTPARYIEAIETVERSGAVVGIIDSASHEWEGADGVLDMAADIEQKSGKAGLHCWRKPKFEHALFMLRLMRSSIPWIVCLRAKYKSRQTKEGGKTVIVKDQSTSPIQAEDFIFEMTCHLEVLQDHSILLTKASHPELRKCFPADKTTPITIEHGKKIAAWCASAGVPKQNPTTATTQANDPLKAAKARLWKILEPVRGNVADWKTASQWLMDKKITTRFVSEMTAPEIDEAADKAEITLNEK